MVEISWLILGAVVLWLGGCGCILIANVLTRARTAEARAEKAERRFAELAGENDRLREAECGRCGRSLPPDGDCHGCRADKLEAEVDRLRDELERWRV